MRVGGRLQRLYPAYWSGITELAVTIFPRKSPFDRVSKYG
jgi:hypothetical protein